MQRHHNSVRIADAKVLRTAEASASASRGAMNNNQSIDPRSVIDVQLNVHNSVSVRVLR